MTFSLWIVPVRFASTFTPLGQLADTVPETDDALCSVMSHFTSPQLPTGRPAMLDEPQAPPKAEAGVVPGLDEEPPPDVGFAELVGCVEVGAPPVLEGARGFESSVLFSSEQPDASVDASSRDTKEMRFMIRPFTVLYRRAQFCHAPQVTAREF